MLDIRHFINIKLVLRDFGWITNKSVEEKYIATHIKRI